MKNTFKKVFIGFMAFAMATGSFAQQRAHKKDNESYPKEWKQIARMEQDSFFLTDEARRIAENVLAFQRCTGGWPKNIDMDAAGNITVYLDSTQFWSAEKGESNTTALSALDQLEYILEISAIDGDKYYPLLLTVNGKLGVDDVMRTAEGVVSLERVPGRKTNPSLWRKVLITVLPTVRRWMSAARLGRLDLTAALKQQDCTPPCSSGARRLPTRSIVSSWLPIRRHPAAQSSNT